MKRPTSGTECAARRHRAEPLVEPNETWVTERFNHALEQERSFYRTEPIEPDLQPDVRSPDGASNVKKPVPSSTTS